MVYKQLIDYRAAACSTMITFFFFALHLGILGFTIQHAKEFWSENLGPFFTAEDHFEDQMYLYYTAAVCVACSSILYGFYLAAGLYTGLILRVIILTSSMIIYVGAIANGKVEDGIDSDVDMDDFNTSDWGHIVFGIAWVFIAGFEVNQMCTKEWGRFISKIQVCGFYTLLATALIIQGAILMDEEVKQSGKVDWSAYDPSVHGKILVAAGAFAALAAVAFMFYMCLDHPEPIKIHMCCVVLFVFTCFGSTGYEYKQKMEVYSDLPDSKYSDFVKEMQHLYLASNIFLGLSLATMLGFNAYFFETAPPAGQQVGCCGPASV